MVRKITLMVGLMATLAIGSVFWDTCAKAQDDIDQAPDVLYRWELPTTGTTVISWNVEIRKNGVDEDRDSIFLDSGEPTFTLTGVEYGATYEIRVQGRDANRNTGQFSPWSSVIVREYDEPSSPITNN